MTTFQISGKALAALALFCGTEPTRPYLGGVYIDPRPGGGTVATATDGCALLSYESDEPPPAAPVIVPVPKAILSGLKKSNLVQYDNGSWTVGNLTVAAPAINSVYPDWRRVVPAVPDDCHPFGNLSPAQLGRLASAAAIVGAAGVALISTGVDRPCLFRFPRFRQFTGAVMPIHIKED